MTAHSSEPAVQVLTSNATPQVTSIWALIAGAYHRLVQHPWQVRYESDVEPLSQLNDHQLRDIGLGREPIGALLPKQRTNVGPTQGCDPLVRSERRPSRLRTSPSARRSIWSGPLRRSCSRVMRPTIGRERPHLTIGFRDATRHLDVPLAAAIALSTSVRGNSD